MWKKETFSFNSANSVFSSTIKTMGKPRDPEGEIEYLTSFNSITL